MCELWEVGVRPVLSLPTLQDPMYRLIVTTTNILLSVLILLSLLPPPLG